MPESTIHGLPLMGTVNPATDEFAIWDSANSTTKRISVTAALVAANPYLTIYSGASTTPQASLWTIVDGRVNQVGLDVQATTGVTSITIPAGGALDGSFDLSPIGSTLSTFISYTRTFAAFSPGVLSNLSTLAFEGVTFTSMDLSGCQNQLICSLTTCTIPSMTLSGSGIYDLNVNGGTYGNFNLSGCPNLHYVFVSGYYPPLALTCGDIVILNSNTLSYFSVGGLYSTFGAISITGCTALSSVVISSDSFDPNTPVFTSMNFSGCTLLATITSYFLPFTLPSLDVSGCVSLQSIHIISPALTTCTVTTLPAGNSISLSDGALAVTSVNAILVALDANGLLNGIVNLSGGTSATPTGAGATAASNLTGKGWTVIIN